MKFQLGDAFIVHGEEAEVVYINHGHAWFAPIADTVLEDGTRLFRNCIFAKADSSGRLSDGTRILSVSRLGGAV